MRTQRPAYIGRRGKYNTSIGDRVWRLAQRIVVPIYASTSLRFCRNPSEEHACSIFQIALRVDPTVEFVLGVTCLWHPRSTEHRRKEVGLYTRSR